MAFQYCIAVRNQQLTFETGKADTPLTSLVTMRSFGHVTAVVDDDSSAADELSAQENNIA